MAVELISFSAAKGAGLKRYFTGAACKRGHVCERMVSNRMCCLCLSEKTAARHRRGQKQRSEATRRSRHSDPERFRAYQKKGAKKRAIWQRGYRQRKPERVKASKQKTYVRTYEAILARNRKRRALERGSSGSHVAADVRDIRRMQRDRCAMPWCRAKLLGKGTVDHITPLVRGGTNDRHNLQLLCSLCNGAKHAKEPADFMRERGLLI